MKTSKRASLESYGLWIWPVTIFIMGLAFYVLAYLIYLSSVEFEPVSKQMVFLGFDNWVKLTQDSRGINAFTVTAIYVIVCLAIEFVVGLGVALALNSGIKGQSVFRSIFILPMMMAPVVTALIFQLMYHSEWGVVSYYLYKLGLLSPGEPLLGGVGTYALPAVMSVDVWQWTPFVLIILFAGLQSLPESPFKAAKVDGASAWQTFRFITIPLMKPILALVFLLRFIDLYRTFDYVYVMTAGGPTGGKTEVISFYAFKQAFGFVKWGYGGAICLLILVSILVICNLIVKYAKIKF